MNDRDLISAQQNRAMQKDEDIDLLELVAVLWAGKWIVMTTVFLLGFSRIYLHQAVAFNL